jgi:Mrp family chromosome partitioning ATPase
MTTLDRAFIKVFDKPSASARHEPRASRTVRPPRVGLSAALADAGEGLAAMGAPHTRLERASREPTAHRADGPRAPYSLAPLSTFAAEPRIEESFPVAREVDRLIWPAACRNLLSRAGRALNGFADHLTERITQGQKSVALASCRRGDGRTTLSLVVASHLAARGMRCLVVDADFENPALAASCSLSAYTGWGQVVDNELPLGEALIAPVDEHVTLMPWRESPLGVAQLAGLSEAAANFGLLRNQFDLTLFDTAPLAGEAAVDAFALLADLVHLDAVYVIHDSRGGAPQELAELCATLRGTGLNVEGIIENFVPPGGAAHAGPVAKTSTH